MSDIQAQGIKVSEVILLNHPVLKNEVKPEVFQSTLGKDLIPMWNKSHPNINLDIFRADRGEGKGNFLLVAKAPTGKKLPKSGSASKFHALPVSSKLAEYISNPEAFVEYHLIGAEHFKSLPTAGLLGIHYLQIKPERAADFEKFVVDKLHPAVGNLFPDMQMLYYKAAAANPDKPYTNYLTIFTIESPAARDKYWPGGQPETEVLKQRFKPLNALAVELSDYLVEGSYLIPGNGAAAYWESRRWTDFIHYPFIK